MDEIPACYDGMKLAQAFLIICGRAVDRLGSEKPADRITEMTAAYMALAWDPSVKALTEFPNVLNNIAENLEDIARLNADILTNWLSYPAEPLNAEQYRKPNEGHMDNQPQN